MPRLTQAIAYSAVAAAVTLSLVQPSGALASSPQPGAAAAAEDSSSPNGALSELSLAGSSESDRELFDLGSLDGPHNNGRVQQINNSGTAVGWYYDDNDAQVPATFRLGTRSSLKSWFPDYQFVSPTAINDNAEIVGNLANGGDSSVFRLSAGSAAELGAGAVTDINAAGDMSVDGHLLDADGNVTVLDTVGGRYIGAAALSDQRVVVGAIDVDPDPNATRLQAFRTQPDKAVTDEDLLTWADDVRTIAHDVNESSIAVGAGRANGGLHPLLWDADGTVSAPSTQFGGEALAVNEAGIAVGTMRDSQGASRAALFEAGAPGLMLQDLVPASSPWILDDAVDINDRGQVLGHMHKSDAPAVTRAYVLDLAGDGGARVVDFDVEEQDYPTGDWVLAEGDETYDGNTIRLRAGLTNTSDVAIAARLEFLDPSGEPVPNGTFDEVVPPGVTLDEFVDVDTAGLAWTGDGSPAVAPYAYTARVTQAGKVTDEAPSSIVVKPRPVVLAHGYKSDAAASWGAFGAILRSGHPNLAGFAVGDGQFPGVMRTGDLSRPYARTNTVQQNAQQEATYIEALRSELDAWHVDITAHSMGGLISRYYLQELMPAAPPDGRPVVNRLVQLGTPNRGSSCADVMMIAGFGRPPLMPATLQLTTFFNDRYFNPSVRRLNGTRISNLAGTLIPIVCGIGEHGDGVVPKYSAFWDLKDVETAPFLNHIAMTESQEAFESYVLPRLKMPPAAGPAGSRDAVGREVGQGAATDALTDVEDAVDAPTAFAAPDFSVAPGEEVTIDLDPGDAESFGLVASTSPSIGMRLSGPDGAVADQFNAFSSRARSPFQTVRTTDSEAGVWHVAVWNEGAETQAVPTVAWLAGSTTTLRTSAEADESGRVRIRATVAHDGEPVNAVATAVIVDAAEVKTTVELFDDGQHDDQGAGDGVYAGLSSAIADGAAAVVVDAETEYGSRMSSTVVEVKQVDRRPRALTLTAQPGGSATAHPAGPTYPYGAQVTLHGVPNDGEIAQGWIVDGVPRPAGDLTLAMDRDHDVVALFGHYTVVELPALPGGRLENTEAAALNNKGQVALNVLTGNEVGDGGVPGRRRAAIYDDGTLRQLPGLPCSASAGSACDQQVSGMDSNGNLVGYAMTAEGTAGAGNVEHATIWRSETPYDLHPGAGGSSRAHSLSDNGQILGYVRPDTTRSDLGFWSSKGAFRRLANTSIDIRSTPGGRINRKGEVAADWLTLSPWGVPIHSQAARVSAGSATKLPPFDGCPDGYDPSTNISSGSAGINASGTVVGWAQCDNSGKPMQAMRWANGRSVSLGDGRANDINDGDLIVGSRWTADGHIPTLWVDGRSVDLNALVPAACPRVLTATTNPCFEIGDLTDVNDGGQIIASGWFRDRGNLPGEWTRSPRALLLTPSNADADLAVTQSATLTEIGPGSVVTRRLRLTNSGPDAATGILLDLTVPPQMTVESCTVADGAGTRCATTPTGVRGTADTLPSDDSIEMAVKLRVSSNAVPDSVLATTATATSRAVRDRAPANNVDTRKVTVKRFLDGDIEFADAVAVGSLSIPVTRTFTNRTEETVTITHITASDGFVAQRACSTELAAGQGCRVTVTFSPTEPRDYVGTVTIETTSPDTGTAVHTLAVTGHAKVENSKPVIQPGAPQVGVVGEPFALEVPFTDADLADTHTAEIVWPNSGPPVPVDTIEEVAGIGRIVARKTFASIMLNQNAVVLLHDSAGNTTLAPVQFSITEKPTNTAPTVSAGGDAAINAGQQFERTGTFVDNGSQSWTATVDYGSGPQPLALNGHEFTLRRTFAEPGRHTVRVTVRDNQGLEGTAVFTVTVVKQNTTPAVHLDALPDGAVTEGDSTTISGTIADPDPEDSWLLTADFGDGTTTTVRTEHRTFSFDHPWSDDGTHAVTVTVRDQDGDESDDALTVRVANAAPTVKVVTPAADTIVAVGAAVNLLAAFQDAGVADTHTSSWLLTDDSGETSPIRLPGTVVESAGFGETSTSHAFTRPGTYRITVAVSDDDGAITEAGGDQGEHLVVHVVNPRGSVTVQGAVDSPTGSCALDTTCGSSGNAPVSATLAYNAVSLHPTGSVRLQTSRFKFESTTITMLMTRNGEAIAQGEAVVNGTVPTRFTMEVIEAPTGKAQLRLRVWRTSDRRLVYDNARGGLVDGAGRLNGRAAID